MYAKIRDKSAITSNQISINSSIHKYDNEKEKLREFVLKSGIVEINEATVVAKNNNETIAREID